MTLLNLNRGDSDALRKLRIAPAKALGKLKSVHGETKMGQAAVNESNSTNSSNSKRKQLRFITPGYHHGQRKKAQRDLVRLRDAGQITPAQRMGLDRRVRADFKALNAVGAAMVKLRASGEASLEDLVAMLIETGRYETRAYILEMVDRLVARGWLVLRSAMVRMPYWAKAGNPTEQDYAAHKEHKRGQTRVRVRRHRQNSVLDRPPQNASKQRVAAVLDDVTQPCSKEDILQPQASEPPKQSQPTFSTCQRYGLGRRAVLAPAPGQLATEAELDAIADLPLVPEVATEPPVAEENVASTDACPQEADPVTAAFMRRAAAQVEMGHFAKDENSAGDAPPKPKAPTAPRRASNTSDPRATLVGLGWPDKQPPRQPVPKTIPRGRLRRRPLSMLRRHLPAGFFAQDVDTRAWGVRWCGLERYVLNESVFYRAKEVTQNAIDKGSVRRHGRAMFFAGVLRNLSHREMGIAG